MPERISSSEVIASRPRNTRRRKDLLRIAARGVRDAWLIAGITLLLLLSLEVAYRAQAAARRSTAGTPTTPASHPYADSAWYPDYREEYDLSTQLEWRSYVYYRRPPFQGRDINIDTAQHRLTTHPVGVPVDAPKIYFFGGSTMWGDYQRDASTIPSIVLARLAAQGIPARATNFGESGYVMTQGVLELVVQLRGGARPDLVVFYDGINDVAAAVQSGRPGIPQNEFNRATEFRLGRAVRGWEEGQTLTSDLRALGLLIATGAERSQLLQRLWGGVRPAAAAPEIVSDAFVAEILASYTGTMRIVEGLAVEYGFRAIYFWQPNPHVSTKAPTEFERIIDAALSANDFQRRLGETHRLLNAQIPDVGNKLVGDRFVNLTSIFESHGGPVWVDQIGHTTEEAAAIVASAIATRLEVELESR